MPQLPREFSTGPVSFSRVAVRYSVLPICSGRSPVPYGAAAAAGDRWLLTDPLCCCLSPRRSAAWKQLAGRESVAALFAAEIAQNVVAGYRQMLCGNGAQLYSLCA